MLQDQPATSSPPAFSEDGSRNTSRKSSAKIKITSRAKRFVGTSLNHGGKPFIYSGCVTNYSWFMGIKPTIDEDKIGTHTYVTSIFIIDPLASQQVHGNPHFLHVCIENNMLLSPFIPFHEENQIGKVSNEARNNSLKGGFSFHL